MNLNVRITVKFLLQIALLFVVVCVIGVASGIYSSNLRNSEQTVGTNPVMILQKMPAATTIHGGTVGVSSHMLKEIKESGGWLQILDENGRAIYNYNRPKNVPTKYTPGLLVNDKTYPVKFGYQLSTWYSTVDNQSLTWLYGLSLNQSKPAHNYKYDFILLALVGSLFAAVIVAFLFGRRIGAPVWHMMNWLQNLAKGSYAEPTDARGVPKSKSGATGSLRRPYKMYREVLTALERLTAALQQSDLERKRLEQTREEWITGITHDLRTPLSSVKGYADLFAAADYVWTENEIRQFGKVISEKAMYMDGLIEDLGLTFRLRNQALPLQRKPENVVEILRRVVIDLLNQPGFQGQTVHFDSKADKLLYPLDVKWFTRALDNLLTNASLHNPAGTAISVEIQPFQKDGYRYAGLRIKISDDGTGMDKETVAHLFDRYYRGTNTTNLQAKGSGLGSAIARQLIEVHGGHVAVESKLGRGTTVVIELPPQN